VVALVAATFGATPAGALPATVTVTPATDLIDGQLVQVTVHDALPGDRAYTRLCQADPVEVDTCSQGFNHLALADDQGTISLELGVEAVFRTYEDVTVDCRVAPGCVMLTNLSRADDTGGEELVTPVAFRPGGPLLPPPTIALDPSQDLVDGTVTHVTGTGFVPRMWVEVVSCRVSVSGYEDCEQPRLSAETDRDGALAVDVYLPTVIFTNDGERVDCRVGACELIATPNLYLYEAARTARAALAFLPDGPLRPPPTLSVEPHEALVDGQFVQITGSGFRPGPVLVALCAAGDGVAFERCSVNQFVETDADGALTASATLPVLIQTSTGYTDCREAPGCTIEAVDFNGGVSLAVVPLAFDPNGPEPARPTVTVAPGGVLAARSGAIVTGTGFEPGSFVDLQQCRIESGLPQECTYLGSTLTAAGPDGGLFAGTLVTAVMAGPDGSEIDCRRVTCGLVAGSFGRFPGIAPLDFGEPPRRGEGRYLSPVFDAVELTEGIVYRQTVNSRGQAVDLKLDVYRPAGDTETRRPAVMWMFGGYFGSGDRVQLREMAQAMARRGYVSVSIDYRTRPEIFSGGNGCVNVGGTCLNPAHLAGAITDARDDARAAMVWLREHAAEYGIEPQAISAAGWSAGAVTALNLAHDASGERAAESIPAAAISLAGVLAGGPHEGDPPTLMMGGDQDTLLPLGAQIGGCSTIVTAGASCEFVAYAGSRSMPEAECVRWAVSCTFVLGRASSHGWFFTDRPDVIDRISTFLVAKVVKPLGLLPREDRPRHHHHHHHHDRDHHHHRDRELQGR
jgi:dienelactone hydrolase